MFFVSVTRLRVKSFWYLPAFFIANERSVKELIHTAGFAGGKELIDKKLTFWTVTIWKDMEAMKTFRNSEAHRKAMQKLPVWCDEASYTHWTQNDDQMPVWATIHLKMVDEGKLTKVKQPSAQQLSKQFPAPALTKSERVFNVA